MLNCAGYRMNHIKPIVRFTDCIDGFDKMYKDISGQQLSEKFEPGDSRIRRL